MTARLLSAVVLVIITGTACTRAPSARLETRSAALPPSPTGCPNTVAGTQMTLSDTADGIAITYTTTGNVVELRRRAASLAERMSAHSGTGMQARHGSTGASARRRRRNRETLPAVTAHVEAVPDGARVVVVPIDHGQRDAVREQVRRHELTMLEGDCAWMNEQPSQP